MPKKKKENIEFKDVHKGLDNFDPTKEYRRGSLLRYRKDYKSQKNKSLKKNAEHAKFMKAANKIYRVSLLIKIAVVIIVSSAVALRYEIKTFNENPLIINHEVKDNLSFSHNTRNDEVIATYVQSSRLKLLKTKKEVTFEDIKHLIDLNNLGTQNVELKLFKQNISIKVNIEKTSLEAPTLFFENNIIKWNNVENAVEYTIEANFLNELISVNDTYIKLKENDFIDGKVLLKVKAVPNEEEILLTESDYSTVIEIKLFENPSNVIYNENLEVISWDKVDDVVYYKVTINDSETITIDSTNVKVSKFTEGINTIKVESYVNYLRTYTLSAETYTFNKLSDPINIDVKDNVITFDAIAGAEYYNVYIDGQDLGKVYRPELYYDFTDTNLSNITIKAYGNGVNIVNSNTVSHIIERLKAPDIYIENYNIVFTHDNFEHVENYVLYIGNKEIIVNVGNTYELNKYDFTYQTNVYARAVAKKGLKLNSKNSNALTIEVLNSPKNLYYENETNKIIFDSVPNSLSYEVTINGLSIGNKLTNEFTFSSKSFVVGENTITIKAIGNNKTIYDSEKVEFKLTKLAQATNFKIYEDKLSFNEVLEATNYEITIKKETYNIEIGLFEYDFSNLSNDQISIRSISSNNKVIYSDPIDVRVSRLIRPTISITNEEITITNNSQDVLRYLLYIDNTEIDLGLNKTYQIDSTEFVDSKNVYVVAISNSDLILNSKPSNSLNISKIIDVENLRYDKMNEEITFDLVDGITTYELTINGELIILQSNKYNIRKDEFKEGITEVTVKAISDDETKLDSNISVLELTKLGKVSITEISDNKISYTKIEDVLYQIIVNGQKLTPTTEDNTLFNFNNLDEATIEIYIYSEDDTIIKSNSTMFSLERLISPIIDIDQGIITITNMNSEAVEHELYINDVKINLGLETSYNIYDYEIIEDMNIYAISVSIDKLKLNSNKSNIITMEKLDQVTNITYDQETNLFEIDEVLNASSYKVIINDTLIITESNIFEFDINNFIEGENIVKVYALNDNEYVLSSDEYVKTYTKLPLINSLSYNGTNLTWNGIEFSKYIIEFNDDIYTSDTNSIEIDIKNLYTDLYIKQYSESENIISSDKYIYKFKRLKTPMLYFNNGNITWAEIDDAVSYTFTINGSSEIVYGRLYPINISMLDYSTLTIKVKANSLNNFPVFESEYSKEIKLLKVEYDYGHSTDSYIKMHGEKFNAHLVADPIKPGHIFKGWKDGDNLISQNQSISVFKNYKLTPSYELIQTYEYNKAMNATIEKNKEIYRHIVTNESDLNFGLIENIDLVKNSFYSFTLKYEINISYDDSKAPNISLEIKSGGNSLFNISDELATTKKYTGEQTFNINSLVTNTSSDGTKTELFYIEFQTHKNGGLFGSTKPYVVDNIKLTLTFS